MKRLASLRLPHLTTRTLLAACTTLLVVAWHTPGVAAPAVGTLVAIGGGAEDPALIKDVLALAKGPATHVAVLNTASGDPAKSGPAYESFFRSLGVASVKVVPLLTHDQAYSPEALDAMNQADLLYFTGGNQIKLVQTLADTPAHGALLAAWQRGAVIAGTSAGAMVWGPKYLVAGSSQAALKGQPGLDMRTGLDLVPQVLIDAHFARESRLGRLLVASAELPGVTGVGVDERTAAVVTAEGIRVIGAGQVTVLDYEHAKVSARPGAPFSARNVGLHLLGAGDSLRFHRDEADRRPMLSQRSHTEPLVPLLALQGTEQPPARATLMAARSGRVPDEVLILAGDSAMPLAQRWKSALLAGGTSTVRTLSASQLSGDTLGRYLATASGVLLLDDAGRSLTQALNSDQGRLLRERGDRLTMAMAGAAVTMPGETTVKLGSAGEVLPGLRLAPNLIATPDIWAKGALDRLVVDSLLADGALGVGLTTDNSVRFESHALKVEGESPVLLVDTSQVSMANPSVPTARDLQLNVVAPGETYKLDDN